MVAASGSNWRNWSGRVLALCRIVLCGIFLGVPEPTEALRIAAEPASLLHAVDGLGWFVRFVPISATIALVAHRVYFTCAIFGLAGFFSRAALWGLLGSAFYLFAIRQLTGVVLHDMHLLWLLALLACTRSAATWSLDSWFRKSRKGTRRILAGREYYLFWGRTFQACCFLFAGA